MRPKHSGQSKASAERVVKDIGRALLSTLVDNDPSRVRRMDVRFSRPVEPGETIRTDIWIESDGKAAFQSTSIERNVTVLSNGYFEFTA
jgi:acyl dehydratase